ncbi:MAG: L,D-transpeptidase family protein [Oscillatoriales cyanobacterium SM2_2_1]|nr:L,D-transpeptidase family protein [Oscillatoriales cyanobacterium SM2_2_1]
MPRLPATMLAEPHTGRFAPDESLTRAHLAVMLQTFFADRPTVRPRKTFPDVPRGHWAAAALQFAYERNLMEGDRTGAMRPETPITRAEVLMSLAAVLDLNHAKDIPSNPRAYLNQIYRDGGQIPQSQHRAIAALTQRGLVVNYPDPRLLAGSTPIRRGELIALFYQSLAHRQRVPPLQTPFALPGDRPTGFTATSVTPDAGQGGITRLEIRISQRRVFAFQGSRPLKSYPVAVGRAGWETPLGRHRVRQMIAYPAWQNPFTGAVIPSRDPENPLGDRWIGFWTNGKEWSGFHGTPNRNSVGQAVSHGCIRMFNEDIRELFALVTKDTIVEVVR